jgi:hypothetical protein
MVLRLLLQLCFVILAKTKLFKLVRKHLQLSVAFVTVLLALVVLRDSYSLDQLKRGKAGEQRLRCLV